ncbi:putative membrane protein [Leptospira interrogans serovar Copenhageni str. LT2050]|nr:putative membrane protein [Leptospira interrogans serovar Copenhageni str. LT2050]
MGLFLFIGIVLFGTIPLWICYVIVLGTCFVYQFTIIKRTIYPLKWIVHTGIFVLLLPIHPGTIVWAIIAGIAGIFLNSLDRLRIQIPLSLIQLLIFLFFYLLLPTVDIFSGIAGKPSLSFRDESISDIFSVLSFSQEGYSPLRFSSLETMGAYSVLFLIPVFLKRPNSFHIPLIFIVGLCIGVGNLALEYFPVLLSAWISFSILFASPGRNLYTACVYSFIAVLATVVLFYVIQVLVRFSLPIFTFSVFYFFIEASLIRIFLGSRVNNFGQL